MTGTERGEIADSDALAPSAATASRDIRVVFSRLRRRLREVADADSDGALSPSQTSVLSRLAREGAWTASELATAERVRPQSMAATLTALDTHGLIRRDADPTDGRRHLVTLTDVGRRRADGDKAARAEWLTRTLNDHYTEDERQALLAGLALLDRLTHL